MEILNAILFGFIVGISVYIYKIVELQNMIIKFWIINKILKQWRIK